MPRITEHGLEISKLAQRSASLVEFIHQNGRGPTLQELRELWGGITRPRVYHLLKIIEKRTGFRLSVVPGRPNPFRGGPIRSSVRV